MPQTDVSQGQYRGGDNFQEDKYDSDSDVPMPELQVQSNPAKMDDVWEGEPSLHSDEEMDNFLGFQSEEQRNNAAVDDDQSNEPKKVVNQKRRKLRTKRNSKKTKLSFGEAKPSNGNVKSSNPPKPKKKRDFTYLHPCRRGQNGWEDSLRPRPAQVDHYQSSLVMKQKLKCINGIESTKRSLFEIDFLNGDSLESETSQSQGSEEPRKVQSKRKPGTRAKTRTVANNQSNGVRQNSGRLNAKKQLPNGVVELKPNGSEQDSDTEPRLDASVGEIVWAKLGSTRWWPAMVIWGSDCGQQPTRPDQAWVFWFGDHKISEVMRDKFIDFPEYFPKMYAEGGSKTFKRGVVEAIRECAAQAKVEFFDSDSTALLNWAKNGFKTNTNNRGVFLPNPENPIPVNVRHYLDKIKALNLQFFQHDVRVGSMATRTPRNECLDNKDSAIRKVKEGLIKIEDVCIACDSDRVPIVGQHPLFQGGLCKQCKDDIIETIYAYGEDGSNAYCVICGNAGELLICDNNDCNRVYCTGCIEIMINPEACKKVLETTPWLCYVCADHDPEDNGLIKKKDDWQQNVTQLFQPEKHVQIANIDDYKEKRPMRVLSLFDGIGTGRFVLDQLGIEIEIYYASEIDPDAMNVATVQHCTKVLQVGSVEDLSDVEIGKLCPIDLVIGGSPCNDLSLVNPARKGLYDPAGTGKLFFDFFRILKAVQLANKGRHVFWMFENVASMPQEYKRTITRFLQVPPITIVGSSLCEPAMLDSKYFSAQNRARYFWGNIPGMYTPLQPHVLKKNVTLDSVLTPNCNRKAVVEKVNTVTTRSNSLKQGKKSILPVVMNGEGDVLWITELEKVFGFPQHYTDVGNIQLGRRQQLLGKAWSVPVIRHIFSPLRDFFKLNTANSSN